jgi:hypothetical protein
MKPLQLVGLTIALALGIVCATPAVGAPDLSPVVALDNGTFSITCRGTSKFTRNTEKLKAGAIEAANAYCANLGKQARVVSTDEHKGIYLVGDFPSVTLVFKALDPTSVEVVGEPGAVAAPSGDLYTILIRLDDLRKKGILTEEEFQSEKKKVLNRSK